MAGQFIWPHSDDIETTGETRRKLKSPENVIILSSPIRSKHLGNTCARLVIEGVELVVGQSRAKPKHVANPGFILYVGTPDESFRLKIRNCLSFCLGTFLVYLGETSFDSDWKPVAFNARSGHALVDEAQELNGWQPAPLGQRWEREINPEVLNRMLSSLCGIYDSYRLQRVFWSYWHALAAPVHMKAAHLGSALEGLQYAYFKASGSSVHGKIIEDEQTWKNLCKDIKTCIAAMDLPEAVKLLLANKTNTLNSAPQSVVLERFCTALGLKIGALETQAWRNRNRAAHGGGPDSDQVHRLIRENKVLLVLMNRILLALGKGSAYYYDYYNLGRPLVRLADPIRDDRAPEAAT